MGFRVRPEVLVMNMNPHTGFRVWGLGFRPQVLATHKYTHADSLLHSKKEKKKKRKKRGLKCWQRTNTHTRRQPASFKKRKKEKKRPQVLAMHNTTHADTR